VLAKLTGIEQGPVTTKAQQKAENANGPGNAEAKTAILLRFCESSEKLSKTKGGSSHPFGIKNLILSKNAGVSTFRNNQGTNTTAPVSWQQK